MMSATPAQRDIGLSAQAALLTLARICGFVLTVPLPLVLVRVLDQREFGLYKQLFQILTSALAILCLHVQYSAYYFMPRHADKKPQVAMNVVVFFSLVGSLTALLFALYPRWITLVFHDDDLVRYMPLFGVTILFWLLSSFLEVVTVANSEVRAGAIFTVVTQLSKSALMLGAGVIFMSVSAIAWAATIQGALQCVILFWYLRNRFGKFWQSFDLSFFKLHLANAIPFGIGGLAYATQADLHNYFVSHYYAAEVFAVYAIGCFQLPLLGMLLDSVISVLLPEVTRRHTATDYRGIIELWANAIRKLAFFFVPVYVFLFVVRREFIIALFTDKFVDAAPIFAINLLNILSFVAVPTSIMRVFEELRYFRFKLSLAMIPVSFAALYIGVQQVGLLGAISAYVFVQTLDLAIIVAKISRRLEVKLADLRLLYPALKTVIASVVAALATYAVKFALGHVPALVTLAVSGAIFGAVFFAVAFFVGAVTDAEKQLLRGVLMKLYPAADRRDELPSVAESR